MSVLALDLSTKSTGYAISNKRKLDKYGCLVSSKADVIERIKDITKQVMDVVKANNITDVIIEEVPPKEGNEHTRKVLMWLQAMIVIGIHDHDKSIPVDFIQSSSWRSKVGIRTGGGVKRSSLKQADIDYVKAHYNIDANDDVCDSICILDAYLQMNILKE